jgi:hypothetical protein
LTLFPQAQWHTWEPTQQPGKGKHTQGQSHEDQDGQTQEHKDHLGQQIPSQLPGGQDIDHNTELALEVTKRRNAIPADESNEERRPDHQYQVHDKSPRHGKVEDDQEGEQTTQINHVNNKPGQQKQDELPDNQDSEILGLIPHDDEFQQQAQDKLLDDQDTKLLGQIHHNNKKLW